MIRERLINYKLTKNFSNRDLALRLNIDEQKVGKILNGRYQGTFKEFEEIVNKISETPEEEYYYCTGKHLPSSTSNTQTTTEQYQSKMLEQMTQLNQMMGLMVNKITELSNKIEMLENKGSHTSQEVNEDQGRKKLIREHVPDH